MDAYIVKKKKKKKRRENKKGGVGWRGREGERER